MAVVWQLKLKNHSGALVALIDDFVGLEIKEPVNGVGEYALQMKGDDPDCALFGLDYQVEAWWRDLDAGIAWRREIEAFHRDGYWSVAADGKLVFSSVGVGYVDLLRRTHIEAYAGSAEAVKSGPAETVIKEYVDEQAGPSAGSRARSGLSVQADGETGETVRFTRPWANLLAVCQEIAQVGGGDFEIVGTGAATFEFRWHSGQLGADRSATVRFSLGFGNMAEPELRQTRSGEINAVLVAGQGSEDARETVWRTDAGLLDDSPWNRCEAFVDARSEADTSGLNTVGDARLKEGKPSNTLTFKVLQTEGYRYGRDYFLGDLVTAEFRGVTALKKIVGVTISVAAATRFDVETADV